MPQPVHYSDHIYFEFLPESLLARPQLAAHIASISARWNEIEARVATLLTILLGAEAKTGISIFFAITNDGAKRAAVDAICNLKLTKQQRVQFQEILKKIGERYADRNHAVHGAWGISDKYPDALLWTDIKEAVLLHVDMLSLLQFEKRAERDARLIAYQKTIQVWKEQDFLDVAKRLQVAYDQLHEFSSPIITKALGPYGRSADPKPSPPIP